MILNRIIPDFVDDNLFSLQRERVRRKLSCEVLSAMTGIKSYMLKEYETGRKLPSMKKYNILAKVFDWDLWEAE